MPSRPSSPSMPSSDNPTFTPGQADQVASLLTRFHGSERAPGIPKSYGKLTARTTHGRNRVNGLIRRASLLKEDEEDISRLQQTADQSSTEAGNAMAPLPPQADPEENRLKHGLPQATNGPPAKYHILETVRTFPGDHMGPLKAFQEHRKGADLLARNVIDEAQANSQALFDSRYEVRRERQILQAQITHLVSEWADFKNNTSLWDMRENEIAHLRQELEETSLLLTKTQEEAHNTKVRFGLKCSELSAAGKMVRDLEKELQRKDSDLLTATSEWSRHKRDLEIKETDISKSGEEVCDLRADLSTKSMATAMMHGENKVLIAEKEQMTKQLASVSSDNSRLQEEVDTQEQKLSALLSERDKLAVQVESRDRSIAGLTLEGQNLRRDLAMMTCCVQLESAMPHLISIESLSDMSICLDDEDHDGSTRYELPDSPGIQDIAALATAMAKTPRRALAARLPSLFDLARQILEGDVPCTTDLDEVTVLSFLYNIRTCITEESLRLEFMGRFVQLNNTFRAKLHIAKVLQGRITDQGIPGSGDLASELLDHAQNTNMLVVCEEYDFHMDQEYLIVITRGSTETKRIGIVAPDRFVPKASAVHGIHLVFENAPIIGSWTSPYWRIFGEDGVFKKLEMGFCREDS